MIHVQRFPKIYNRIISRIQFQLKRRPEVSTWQMNLVKHKKELIPKIQLFPLWKIYNNNNKLRITPDPLHSQTENQALPFFKIKMINPSRLPICSQQNLQKRRGKINLKAQLWLSQVNLLPQNLQISRIPQLEALQIFINLNILKVLKKAERNQRFEFE